MKFIEQLKQRWGITNNFQIVVIFFVFAITGMSAVQIKKPIFDYLEITSDTPFYVRIPLWLLVITPFYYMFLLFYGFIFGQFSFFWKIFKKTFGRFPALFKKKSNA